jgi:lipopolysaccharide biosynthesis glycosyltransferase
MYKPQVYIGFDNRESEAFDVLKYSIKKHCPPANITGLIQNDLRRKGIYTRPTDEKASTDFSLTRFLVPYLNDYTGWALFMDSDMLVTTDIQELFSLADPHFAVQVVKHNHQPFESRKMDDQVQTRYEKKNWSSVVLYNCGHEKNKNLLPEVVNAVSPAYLHRFWWLQEQEIGDLPMEWNFLVDYYKKPSNIVPKNIHFTSGGPWFSEYRDVDYSELWYQYKKEMKRERDY